MKKGRWANLKLFGMIVPIVLFMIIFVFLLARKEIIRLSQDKLALESKNYAEDISTWAEQVLSELNIYRIMVEKMGLEDERTYDMMETSCDTHDAYPYGLYLGNESGFYFDSSGWVPGEDFVVVERDWYQEGLDNDQFSFGEPYVDAMTGETCVSATTRIYNASVTTVLSADVYLDYASSLVKEITQGNIDIAMFVTRGSKVILADSDGTMVGKMIDDENNTILYQNINQLLDQGVIGQSKIRGEDGIYLVDINAIKDTDWYFVTCMNQENVLSELEKLEIPMFFVAFGAIILLNVVTVKVAGEMSVFKAKAKTDPLTGLFNREGFRELMRNELETNPKQGALMILDLDNFKLVNDELGHPVGDQVLRQFAGILKEYFDINKDFVARIGGDEFAVYLGRNISKEETEELLTGLVELIHKSFAETYPDRNLTSSIGVALTSENISYDTLYQNADAALYEVKREGKDSFKISH